MDTTTEASPRRRRWIIAAAVIAVPLLALAWYLGSPLFLNKTVNEAFPTIPAVAAEDTTDPLPPTTVEAAGGPQPEATPSTTVPEVSEPVPLLRGMFTGADSFHQGSGDVAVYELADGSRVLRFEGLDVTNGPDLHVIVSPVAGATDRGDVMASGYVDLGGLKGNRGDQNYDLPSTVDVTGPLTVVIYCDPFHVIFATGPLTPA